MLDSVPPPAAPAVSTACLLEGVWSEGLDFHAETEAHPPFRVTHASQGWLAFCGFRPSEVLGKSLSQATCPRKKRAPEPTSDAVAPASFSA